MLDRNFYFCAARSDQKLTNLRIRLAAHRLTVNFQNAIAKAKSGARSRSVLERRADVGIDRVVLTQVADGCPDAEVLRTLLGLERGKLYRIEIG